MVKGKDEEKPIGELCIICKEELVTGYLEDYGLCPICGDMVDDITAMYFEDLIKRAKAKSVDRDRQVEELITYLDEIVGWEEFFESNYSGFLPSGRKRYYETLINVVNWLKENMEFFKRLLKDRFSRCPQCKRTLAVSDYVRRRRGDWIQILCKNCGAVIAKSFSPISHF